MTAKDKAQELLLQFSDIGLIVSTEAKQCALIAVEEILDSYTNEKSNGFIISDKIILYWEEVKQEIINL
jgi:hypothetical protein